MQPIYSGRTIVCGQSGGSPFMGYRLSSRSFANRQLRLTEPGRVQVFPTDATGNPGNTHSRFIFYDCLITNQRGVICANGVHGDSIAVKLKRGSSALDALTLGLLSWDFEDDGSGTPRIGAVLEATDSSYINLGIVLPNSLHVDRLPLHEGQAYILATNNYNGANIFSFSWQIAAGAEPIAEALLAGNFIPQVQLSHPIAAVGWQNGETAIVGLR